MFVESNGARRIQECPQRPCRLYNNSLPERKINKQETNKRKKNKKKTTGKIYRRMYREHQRLYFKDKKVLPNLILNEKDKSSECKIDVKIIEDTYMERFGGESQAVDLSKYPVESTQLLSPVTPEETVKRMKKDTSAGPDGIDIKKLLNIDRNRHILTNMFNTFLVTRAIPIIIAKKLWFYIKEASTWLELET
jgi:hypothetical protein